MLCLNENIIIIEAMNIKIVITKNPEKIVIKIIVKIFRVCIIVNDDKKNASILMNGNTKKERT